MCTTHGSLSVNTLNKVSLPRVAFSLIIQKVCGVGHAGRELGSGSGHRNNLTNNLHSPSHHILKLLIDEQSHIFTNNIIHNLGNSLSIIVLFVSIKGTMICPQKNLTYQSNLHLVSQQILK